MRHPGDVSKGKNAWRHPRLRRGTASGCYRTLNERISAPIDPIEQRGGDATFRSLRFIHLSPKSSSVNELDFWHSVLDNVRWIRSVHP